MPGLFMQDQATTADSKSTRKSKFEGRPLQEIRPTPFPFEGSFFALQYRHGRTRMRLSKSFDWAVAGLAAVG